MYVWLSISALAVGFIFYLLIKYIYNSANEEPIVFEKCDKTCEICPFFYTIDKIPPEGVGICKVSNYISPVHITNSKTWLIGSSIADHVSFDSAMIIEKDKENRLTIHCHKRFITELKSSEDSSIRPIHKAVFYNSLKFWLKFRKDKRLLSKSIKRAKDIARKNAIIKEIIE